MAYSSWSVVFGEQPSAAKWNILGTNDASFNDGSGIQPSNPIIAASGALDLRGNSTGGVLTQLRTQAIDGSTNATTSSIRFQVGSGYVSGDATESSVTTVTFPTAFTTPLGVLISNSGELADANPTSITDGGSGGLSDTVTTVLAARSITTTNFVAVAKRTAASNGKRVLFSWLAWGV